MRAPNFLTRMKRILLTILLLVEILFQIISLSLHRLFSAAKISNFDALEFIADI